MCPGNNLTRKFFKSFAADAAGFGKSPQKKSLCWGNSFFRDKHYDKKKLKTTVSKTASSDFCNRILISRTKWKVPLVLTLMCFEFPFSSKQTVSTFFSQSLNRQFVVLKRKKNIGIDHCIRLLINPKDQNSLTVLIFGENFKLNFNHNQRLDYVNQRFKTKFVFVHEAFWVEPSPIFVQFWNRQRAKLPLIDVGFRSAQKPNSVFSVTTGWITLINVSINSLLLFEAVSSKSPSIFLSCMVILSDRKTNNCY